PPLEGKTPSFGDRQPGGEQTFSRSSASLLGEREQRGHDMIRTATRALGSILGVLLIAAPGFTQTAHATLRGVALDQQGGVLPGVTITVRQADTNTVQITVSGAEGQFFLPNLRPGRYEVTSELSGFAPTKQQLDLRVGQDVT